MIENGTNTETRCGDCGLIVHQAANGRCPRCGARLDAPDSSYPVLPYGDLINPYETQYYSIRDGVMEGRFSKSTMGDFLVSSTSSGVLSILKTIPSTHMSFWKSLPQKATSLPRMTLVSCMPEAIAFRETIMLRFAFTVSLLKKGIHEQW